MRLGRMLLAVAFATLLAAYPQPAHPAEEEPGHDVVDEQAEASEGVLYDPKADYDQGVFEAEEEIAADAMTIWVLTPTNCPPATDTETGLPVRHLLVDPSEPWHRRCMQERARGHNDTIRRQLGLPAGQADAKEADRSPAAETNVPAFHDP